MSWWPWPGWAPCRCGPSRCRRGTRCSTRRVAKPCTGTPGPATRRPTPSSPGLASRSRRATASSVQHVRLKDTAEAVTRVVAEKSAGRDSDGTVDLIWINGPNFLAMKRQNLLYGPVTAALPNFRYVDVTHKRSNVIDFTTPVDGMAVPWRMAQIVFIYDSARITDPADVPRSAAAMLEWSQKHPGRLTHPAVEQFPRCHLLQAGAARTGRRPVAAATARHRCRLCAGHRAAVGLVRRLAPDAVAQGAAIPDQTVPPNASC